MNHLSISGWLVKRLGDYTAAILPRSRGWILEMYKFREPEPFAVLPCATDAEGRRIAEEMACTLSGEGGALAN